MKTTEPPSWLAQINQSIKNIEELKEELLLTDEENIEKVSSKKLPLRITRYYLDQIKKNPILRKTTVPTIHEFEIAEDEFSDPLEEENHNPVKCIVHKYKDRVLFLVSNFCSVNCRYCVRSRIIDNRDNVSKQDIDLGIEYIRNHSEIRDVLLSGGDPLTMSDGNLEYILQKLHVIPHVEIIRIGTKVPVVLPSRITKKFVEMLKKYHPLYMSIHFTHSSEITDEVKKACNRLADAGIPLGSQTVLLKDINDDVDTMRLLMHELLKIRVKPYYIYALDHILGSKHFRSTIEKGIEIIKSLRGHTTGYAVPTFIVDSKYGKIAVNPDSMRIENNKIILTSYEGKELVYENSL